MSLKKSPVHPQGHQLRLIGPEMPKLIDIAQLYCCKVINLDSARIVKDDLSTVYYLS